MGPGTVSNPIHTVLLKSVFDTYEHYYIFILLVRKYAKYSKIRIPMTEIWVRNAENMCGILITNLCRKKNLGLLPSLKKGAERICLLSEAIILVFQQLNSSWCDARWYIPIGALRCSRLHHGPLQSVG